VLTAIVYDTSGNPMPAGTLVAFTEDSSGAVGTLSLPFVVTIDDTGTAITTFLGAGSGTSTISAASGLASQTTTVGVTTSVLPTVGYIELTSEPETIPILGSSVITAVVYDASGNPMPAGTTVSFTEDSGGLVGAIITTPVVTLDDTGTAITTFTGAGAGTASITATSGLVTQTTTVGVTTSVLPTVGYIELTSEPETIPILGSSVITAVVYDASGNPMPAGTTVSFTEDSGGLVGAIITTPVVTLDDTGTAITTFTGAGAGTASITATSGLVTQTTTVSVTTSVLPTVGYIELTRDPEEIPIGGSSVLTAIVYDASGNPMPAGTLVTFTEAGGFGTIATSPVVTLDDTGTAITTFLGTGAGTATITAASGAASQTTTVGVGGGSGVEVAAIGIVAAQTALSPFDTTTITAIVYDSSGHGLANQLIEFIVDDPTLGFITAVGTTAFDGSFVADFEARQFTGTVNVTATSGGTSSAPLEITIKTLFADAITLTVNPTAVTVTKTATVSAYLSIGGVDVPSETVSFIVQDPVYGTITSSAVTNAVGVATATFTAASFPGVATITATSGALSANVNINIQQAEAASIEFVSVSINPISIRGTGGQEFAIVTFNVRDVNGNPAEDVDVLFTMVSGIMGDEYLEDPNDGTPYSQTIGTSAGVASVTLHSGYEAGTVSVTASTVTSGGTTISATTPIISIGGGVPTDEWLVVSCAEPGWNLGGLNCVGSETEMTAWLADRFGNYNVLDGHTVSFETEIGLAVNPIGTTDAGTGAATTTIRTQGAPKDVIPETWEENMKTYLASNSPFAFGTSTAIGSPLPSGHPRDGVCSVLVFTIGEESFVDGSNGNLVNGVYDFGEDFVDTADDPWRDYDDDGLWDDGTTTTPDTTAGGVNPEEDEYQDRAGNNMWDGVDTFWDGNKNIYRQVDFLVTGTPYIRLNKNSFTVPNGGSDFVNILVCDENYNPMSAGSTYEVSVSKGIVGGTISREYPSSSFYGSETTVDWDTDGDVDDDDYSLAQLGLVVFTVTIGDDDTAEFDPPEAATLEVTVTWKSEGCGDVITTYSIAGTVD